MEENKSEMLKKKRRKKRFSNLNDILKLISNRSKEIIIEDKIRFKKYL